MRKLVVCMLAMVLCLITLADCFADENEIGILTQFSVTAEELNEKQVAFFSAVPFTGFRFFDTLNNLVIALESGTIGAIETDENVAGFLLAQRDGLARYNPDNIPKYEVSFCMLLREDEDELCGLLSRTIQDLEEDGTLDALRNNFIVDVIAGKEPEAVEPEQFQDAGTIKVALTGDRPPMDYFSAEGKAIGFNTALVAEIAKRIRMNVEFIHVDSGARAIALASGDTDVIFWSQIGNFKDWKKADTGDQPENTIVTEPYMKSTLCYIVREDSSLVKKPIQ